jgi:hypothetical protein
MNVWFAIPSCRPAAEAEPILAKWRERGYKIALLRQGEPLEADLTIQTDHYLGWAPSINILARFIVEHDPDAEFIVSGGDDTEPDTDHAAEKIGRECREYFEEPGARKFEWIGATFGVMQPTGDLKLWPGSAIDRFAGSPWMGREFCRRMYGGSGPLFDGYHHMFADEELQEVATKLGVFWQRPDLIHKHMHWGRRAGGARREDIPDFLQHVNSREHWNESEALFNARKAAGWPGHEPIA